MQPIIVDMNDMSESVEVYESKPNPFLIYFIYLILIIITVGGIWMYFSRIDIVVKSNGMFQCDEEKHDVSSSVTGKIDKCKIEDGQYVEKGDLLLSLDVDSVDDSIENYNSELEDINQRIEILQAYQKSLDGDNTNFNTLKKNKYYEEFNNRKKLVDANICSSDKNVDGQVSQYQANVDSINDSINQYNNQIAKLQQAEVCVKDRNNTFDSSADSYYYSIVNSYTSNYDNTKVGYDNQIQELLNNIDNASKQIEELENNEEDQDTSRQETTNSATLEELKRNKSTYENNLESIKSEKEKALQNIELQQLASLEQEIEVIKTTLITLKSNLATAQAQIEALNSTNTDNTKNISIMTEKNNVNTELLTYQNKNTECENNLKTLETQNSNCNILANKSGYISLQTEVQKGAYVQEGVTILQILPESTSGYYAELYVANKDIAKLKEGQKVKFEISAYPSSEYGYFTGVIESIPKDIKVNESTGSAYYLVKVKCDKMTMTNKKGETGTILNGMACQAKAIIDEQSVLRYLLEKIDLL